MCKDMGAKNEGSFPFHARPAHQGVWLLNSAFPLVTLRNRGIKVATHALLGSTSICLTSAFQTRLGKASATRIADGEFDDIAQV
jgi:hypothetical protein